MKNFFLILLLLLVVDVSLADINGTGLMHGRHSTNHAPDPTPTPMKNEIMGQCQILPGNGNMMGGPCSNIVLTLNAGKGKDILNTRSTAEGHFEFNAPQAESYKIGVSSRLYEIISPTDAVQNGENIELQLRQK